MNYIWITLFLPFVIYDFMLESSVSRNMNASQSLTRLSKQQNYQIEDECELPNLPGIRRDTSTNHIMFPRERGLSSSRNLTMDQTDLSSTGSFDVVPLSPYPVEDGGDVWGFVWEVQYQTAKIG